MAVIGYSDEVDAYKIIVDNEWKQRQQRFADYLSAYYKNVLASTPENLRSELISQANDILTMTPEKYIERFRTEEAIEEWFYPLSEIVKMYSGVFTASTDYDIAIEQTNKNHSMMLAASNATSQCMEWFIQFFVK